MAADRSLVARDGRRYTRRSKAQPTPPALFGGGQSPGRTRRGHVGLCAAAGGRGRRCAPGPVAVAAVAERTAARRDGAAPWSQPHLCRRAPRGAAAADALERAPAGPAAEGRDPVLRLGAGDCSEGCFEPASTLNRIRKLNGHFSCVRALVRPPTVLYSMSLWSIWTHRPTSTSSDELPYSS